MPYQMICNTIMILKVKENSYRAYPIIFTISKKDSFNFLILSLKVSLMKLLYFPKFQLGTEMGSWDISEKVAKKPEKLKLLILKTPSFVHNHALDIIFISFLYHFEALWKHFHLTYQTKDKWNYTDVGSKYKLCTLNFKFHNKTENDMSNESTFTRLQNYINYIQIMIVDNTRGL